MALGVMTYARERGIDVPGELSVTGFDGIDAAQRLGLTTIIQPNKAKGAAAGHMLHHDQPERVAALLQAELPRSAPTPEGTADAA